MSTCTCGSASTCPMSHDTTPTPTAQRDAVIEAMARAIDPDSWRLADSGRYNDLPKGARDGLLRRSLEQAAAAYDAALPLIEDREAIAQAIEARRADGSAVGDATFNDGLNRAAGIVRTHGTDA